MIDLYRFYDAKGKLLYVGISLNAAARAATHRKGREWWTLAARMEIDHMDCDREEALERERQAISGERPLYNTNGRGNGARRARPPRNPNALPCPVCNDRAIEAYRKTCDACRKRIERAAKRVTDVTDAHAGRSLHHA